MSFLVPPQVLFAQDAPPRPQPAPARQEATTALDMTVVDQLDVEPRSGSLLLSRTDLVVGEGDRAFPVRRHYRPAAGDSLNFSLDWVSVLDHHLDVLPSGERASFVDQNGLRVFFERDDKGHLVSTTGRQARVEVKEDGYVLSGLGDDSIYRFGKGGWLLSRSDANYTLTYHYGEHDLLAKVEGPWGELKIRRNKAGVLTSIEAPDGRRVRYERDAEGNLSQVTRSGLHETYRYDPAGRLTSVADGKALIAYDAVGRVIRLGGPGLRPRTLSYTQGGGDMGQATLITQGDRTWRVAVSTDGRRIETTGPDELKTTVYLDDRNRPERLVQADGREWRRVFDERGRIVERYAPRGLTRFDYESKVTDRPTKVRLPDGRWMAYDYDLRGKLIEAVSSSGARMVWRYDAGGLLSERVDRRGAVTRYTRNKAGQVVEIDEQGLGTTRFVRNQEGRLLGIKQPDGRVTRVEWGADGRLTRIADGRGPAVEKTFDARGRLVKYSDPLGRTFDYSWTDQGELKEVRDALGKVIGFDYDDAGQLESVADAENNLTTIKREGRRLTISDPTQGERILERDAKGRLVTEIREGQKVTYTYDALGQVTKRVTPEGEETFDYDRFGRLVGMKGPDGALRMAFDEDGQLEKLINPTLGKTIEYSYAKTGDRTSMRLPWGTVRYTYDVQGRVESIQLPEGGTIHLEHHPDGRRKAIRYPNGVVTTFEYKRTRLTRVETKKDEKVLEVKRYGYDKNGRVAWTEGLDGARTKFEHDVRGRLTAVRGPSETVTYSYDAMGNRTEEVRGKDAVAAKVGAGNRVVSQGSKTYSYSATGALSSVKDSAGTTRYVYDADEQLVRVEKPDGEVVRYGYAPNGTRLWRQDKGGKTQYLHDLADVVGEFDGAGTLEASFVHGPDTDDVLSALKGGERFFYHYDLVRSVTAMTGKQGRVAARYDYDAFGGQQVAEGDAAAWNPFRYTSRTLDGATGLYDYRARSYSPELGRFTSPDPAGLRGGLNLYTYAANDPTLFNDPFGFWPDWLDSAASWTMDKVDAVGGAIDTAVTTVGGLVDDGVTAAGGWVADNLLPEAIKDEVSYLGRQTWAFTRGFGKGLYGAGKGVVTMVRHPVDTYNGVKHAIENWDETKERLLAVWEEYKDAAVNDPEKFAEWTGILAAEIVFSVAGTKGLDKVAKAGKIGTVARGVANSSRVARVTRPVVNAATRTTNGLARRFPRVANAVRDARVLSRARNIELAGRTANPGRLLTRIPRRIATFGRDLYRGGRLAVTRPGAFVLYSGGRLGSAAMSLVAATGRGLWKAGKYGTIPVLVTFEDEITDAVKRSATRDAALGEVTKAGRGLLNDAPNLTPEDLALRVRDVGAAYVNYRNRLLKPIHEEDLALDERLRVLDEKVAAGEIPAETIDSRLNAMLEDYGRRRHNLMVDLYDRNRDEAHDMLHPSPNRTISFQDEVDLLEEVKKRVTDPAATLLLDARIADVKATMEHEYALFRAGDHDDLIAGIAGPPRPAGEEASNELGLDGLDMNSVEYMPDSGNGSDDTVIIDSRR